MELNDNTLGSYLKKLRKSSTYTLNEIKNRTGISKSSLSEWENDKRIPTQYSLERLAELYQVDIIKFYHLIQMMGIPKYDRVHIALEQNSLGETKDKIIFDDAIFKLTNIHEYFFTKKEDHSLETIGIIVDSLVLCRKTKTLENHNIGIFRMDDSAIMREIEYINKEEAYLIPHSNDKSFEILKVSLKEITIVAQVEKVIIDFVNNLSE